MSADQQPRDEPEIDPALREKMTTCESSSDAARRRAWKILYEMILRKHGSAGR